MKPITIEELTTYHYYENPVANPSRNALVYQVAKANKKKDGYDRNIWLYQDGKTSQLTSSLPSSIVCWSDDEHVLLLRKEEPTPDGMFNIYEISTKGGEALPKFKLPFAPAKMERFGKGYIILAEIDANDPDLYKKSSKERTSYFKNVKDDADYHVVDEVPYYLNGRGYYNKKRMALFLYDEKTLMRITPKYRNVEGYYLNGNEILYWASEYQSHQKLDNKIYSYQPKTKKTKTVLYQPKFNTNSVFKLKDKFFVYGTDGKDYGINETGSFYSLKNGKFEFLKKIDRSFYNIVLTDTTLGGGKQWVTYKDHLYALVTEDSHTQIRVLDHNLKEKVLWDKKGMVSFLEILNDEIVMSYTDATHLAELYSFQKNQHKPITNLNVEPLKDHYVAKPNRVSYQSKGYSLEGWVLYPKDYKKGKKYPAVLDIHGGPRCAYGEVFFHEMQVWASKGYFVLFTNIKGSDGRGDAFADIRGDYGGTDYENLMDFVDAAIKKYPDIQTKKLCVTGGSYGGFMTNWIIGHTDRFVAAASQRSISNWISMAFTSDIGEYFSADQNGAKNVFDGKKELWDHSPLKFATKVKTPTLFIHSEEDYRCPVSEGIQMMQALAFRNIETRMILFKGENHELSRSGMPKHRIRRLKEITNWFEKHVR